MANQIEKGHTFVTGELVTAQKLNNLVDNATLRPECITDQNPWPEDVDFMWPTGPSPVFMPQGARVLVHDESSNQLYKIRFPLFLNAGYYATFGGLVTWGITEFNSDTYVRKRLDITTNLNVPADPLNNPDMYVIGGGLTKLDVYGAARFLCKTAIKLPTGQTDERPIAGTLPLGNTANDGHIRFNTSKDSLEVYSQNKWTTVNNRTALIWLKSDNNNFDYSVKNQWTDIPLSSLSQSDNNFVVNSNDFNQTSNGNILTTNEIRISGGTYLIEASANFLSTAVGPINSLKAALRILVNGGTENVGEIVSVACEYGAISSKSNASCIVTLGETDNIIKLQYYLEQVTAQAFDFAVKYMRPTSYIGGTNSVQIFGYSKMFDIKITQLK